MTDAENEGFPCDLCGSQDAREVPHCREYTNDQPIHICNNCGFVFVRNRRSAAEIAETWSSELYGSGYTARIPAVKARQIYVAETIDNELGLRGSTLCDIGGGEGQFLEIARSEPYCARPFAIEPSEANCRTLTELRIENYQGTIEDFLASDSDKLGSFDFVTIMWTLENCRSCREMLAAANSLLRTGGHIVVATGSRLLVPFKKPLHYYLSKNPADTHAFRFSANTLRGLLAVSGFKTEFTNRYIDTDFLVVMARKMPTAEKLAWTGDNPDEVSDFFSRWHAETAAYYNDA